MDDETFEMLRAAYEEVDFSGEFELGDPELYDEYREKYWRMLQNNGPVMDKETGRMMSITDLDSDFDYNNWKEFYYYFYDVDGDGAPELGIYSFARFIYLFDYDEETDQFRVWFEMGGYYYRLVGTRKVMFSNLRTDNEFYLLDENGDFECVTIFNYDFRSGRNDEARFLRIVMLPFHADKKVEPTQGMKENGIYVRYRGDWYFRLTDEQKEKFTDVYQAYYDALESEKDGEVCYKYEELFGDFIQEASQE